MADARLLFPPGWQLTDSNDDPVSSGVVKFFDSGTSNPRTVYSDPSLSTSLGTEISTNSAGRPASGGNEVLVYASEGNLTLQALTSASASLWSFDDVLGALDTGGFEASAAAPDRPVLTKVASYTAVNADRGALINLNANSNPTTLTLPDASSVGDGWMLGVKNIHATATDVGISAFGSQTIDGFTSYSLNRQYRSVELVSDAANWHVLSGRRQHQALENPGFLYGLTLSNGTDATNDIDIAVGSAADDTALGIMALTSAITKRLDASWSVGTGNGGLDTGSIADTTYHVFLIRRPDTGVVDALFSASATAPTMPANYTQKRRIGSFKRASSAIRPFWQNGDVFLLQTRLSERTDSADVAWGLITLAGVPTGITAQPILSAEAVDATDDGASLSVADARDTSQTSPLVLVRSGSSGITGVGSISGGIFTDTSARIHYTANEENALTSTMWTRGWIDTRGRV